MKFFDIFTQDRAAHGTVYTTEQLGPKQSLTPEGFLLCEDVPLARSGEMLYGPYETPVQGDGSGPVVIHRELHELFRPETIASFNGKDVTNEHPDEDVTPKNWKKHTCGVLLNVRKGEGDNEGMLVGDLLVKDPSAIDDIKAHKREVSLGYDADYEELSPGVGRQTNIIGNHVALVERGRCGPRCAIGDQETISSKEKSTMSSLVKNLFRRRSSVADAVAKIQDAAAEAIKALEDGEGNTQTADEGAGGSGMPAIHIHMEGPTAPANASVIDEAPEMQGGYGGSSGGPEQAVQSAAQGVPTEDDPIEARFKTIEGALAQISTALATLQQSIGQQTAHEQAEGDLPEGFEQELSQDDAQAAGLPMDKGPQAGAEVPPTSDAVPEGLEEELESSETKDNTIGNNSTVGTAKTGDKAFRTRVKDSAPLEASYRETLSLAEILVPGFRMSTFDRAADPVATFNGICGARRKALDTAYATADGKALIDSVNGGKPLDTSKMTCQAVRSLFVSAAGTKKLLNNAAATRDASRLPSQNAGSQPKKVQSIEDLNAMYKAHYAAQSAKRSV